MSQLLRNQSDVFSFQIPFYRGERITFDVAPSRLDFFVEHDSLQIEVRHLEKSSCLYQFLWKYN